MLVSAGQTALKRYGFDDNDPLLVWMNAGMRYVEEAHDWSFLQTTVNLSTVASSPTLVLPLDLFKIQSLHDYTHGYKLEYISISEFERRVIDPSQLGVPELYTVGGQKGLQLYPTPDSIIPMKLVYQLEFTEMSSLVVEMPGPSRMHFPIIQAAAAIGLQAENEEARAISAQKEADAAIERLWGKFSTQELDEPQQVTDVMSYGSG